MSSDSPTSVEGGLMLPPPIVTQLWVCSAEGMVSPRPYERDEGDDAEVQVLLRGINEPNLTDQVHDVHHNELLRTRAATSLRPTQNIKVRGESSH